MDFRLTETILAEGIGGTDGNKRMDFLPYLRKQNEVADTGRYRTEKLSTILPKVQTGKFD